MRKNGFGNFITAMLFLGAAAGLNAANWPIADNVYYSGGIPGDDNGKLTLKGGRVFPRGNFAGVSEISKGAEIFFSLGEPASLGLIYSNFPVAKKRFAVITFLDGMRLGFAEPVINSLSTNLRFGGTRDNPMFFDFGAGISLLQFKSILEVWDDEAGQWIAADAFAAAFGFNNQQYLLFGRSANAAIGIALPLPAGFEFGAEARVYAISYPDLKKLSSALEAIEELLKKAGTTLNIKFKKPKTYDLFFAPSIMLSFRF